MQKNLATALDKVRTGPVHAIAMAKEQNAVITKFEGLC